MLTLSAVLWITLVISATALEIADKDASGLWIVIVLWLLFGNFK